MADINTPKLLNMLACRYLRQTQHRNVIVKAMRDCDVLFIYGIEASILATIYDIPFIFCSHGGDSRIDAGLTLPPKV